jgi:hypothetical protein
MKYEFKIESIEKGIIVVEAESFPEAEEKASEANGEIVWEDVCTSVTEGRELD